MNKLNKIIGILFSDKFKGAIAIVAAVVMYITPDYVDEIIESLLAAFGVATLIMDKKCKT